jgi:catechol 2,3-dioxygenase-like lactoylglutathione lyase family enzyme
VPRSTTSSGKEGARAVVGDSVRLGLLLLYVEDFPMMIGFYRDVIGLELTDEDPGPEHRQGVDWAQLAGDGGTIKLFDHRVFGRTRELPLPRRNGWS